MTNSRDREEKRAGEESPAPDLTDAEVVARVDEVCQIVRQQNRQLSERLRQQQELLLSILQTGRIQ